MPEPVNHESSRDDDQHAIVLPPQIHTTDDGRHFDDQGLEYDAVLVDGREWLFVPRSLPTGFSP